jgi:hypothetical protein
MATIESQSTAKSVDLSKLWPIGVVFAFLGIGGLLLFSGGVGDHFYGSYIFGLIFWAGTTLGCFGLALLHHATRASWSISILRLLEAGGGWASLILIALLFIPLLGGGMHVLYEWTHHEEVMKDPILAHKAGYLNETFWLVRLAIYFAIWIGWSLLMQRSTIRQDQTKDYKLEAGRMSWGAAGLVMFFVTVTFAVLDWVMSMNPHWYSTMYGAWLVVGSAYGALALMTAIVCHNAQKEPYRSIVSPHLTRDLGNMLFVHTMLWGYTTLSQFLIIWNGNIPETTSYYKTRMAMYPPGMQANWWAIIGFILIVGMFFIPFYALIAPRVKKYPNLLKNLAIWMFIMAVLNMFLIVVPSVPHRADEGPFKYLLTDVLAWLGIGGLWFMVFGFMTKKAPLVPLYDTRLQEAKANAH